MATIKVDIGVDMLFDGTVELFNQADCITVGRVGPKKLIDNMVQDALNSDDKAAAFKSMTKFANKILKAVEENQ